MITPTREELEAYVGMEVMITTDKQEYLEGVVEGVSHTDNDSYLILGDRRFGCKGIVELGFVMTEEEIAESIETPTDEEFNELLDMHVDSVFSSWRYRVFTDPDAALGDAQDDVIATLKLTDEQADKLADAVAFRAQRLEHDAEDEEMSDDVKEALDDAAVAEKLEEAAAEASANTSAGDLSSQIGTENVDADLDDAPDAVKATKTRIPRRAKKTDEEEE